MIELISIFLFLIFYSVIFCKSYISQNQIISFKDFNYNIIILLNLCLFCSFFVVGKYILLFFCFFIFLKNLNFFLKNLKELKLIIFFIINFIFFTLLIYNPDLGWDGIANWYPKTYSFFNNQSITALKELPRSDYPHLGPYVWSVGWYFSPLKLEYFGRLINIFIYFSAIFLFFDLIKKNLNYKLLVIFFLVILTINFNLFKGYQEHLIFSLLCFFIFIYHEEKNQKIFTIFSLLIINCLIWIKNESILFVIPIFFLIIIKKNTNNKNKFLFSLSFFLILFLRYFLIKYFGEASLQGNQFSIEKILSEIFNFRTFFYDLYYILKYLFLGIVKNPIILIFIFLNFCHYRQKKLHNFSALTIFYIVIFFELFFIYHIVDSKNLIWMLSSSMDRLLFQISGLLIFDVMMRLEKIK